MNKFLLISIICAVLLSRNALAQERLYKNTFPLGDVTLLDGPFKHARDLNVQVLLKYDVDRLLAPFRNRFGRYVRYFRHFVRRFLRTQAIASEVVRVVNWVADFEA